MSSNKIGGNNKDILMKVMFNIKHIKAEEEVKILAIEEEDTEEGIEDSREVDMRDKNIPEDEVTEVDMREKNFTEVEEIEAIILQLHPISFIIQDLGLLSIKTLTMIMAKINAIIMKIKKNPIIKSKVNILLMKSKNMHKKIIKSKVELYLMMKNITKNK